MTLVRSPFRFALIALLLSSVVVETGLWLLSGPTSRAAIALSVAGTLLAATGLWHLTGRFELPPRPTPGFLGVMAVGALLFGNFMLAGTYWAEGLALGIPLKEAARASRSLGAEFLFWLWLYGLLAAGAYGSRIRQTMGRERERRIAAQAAAAEARLEALRGQLNPHFLFNALHGVSALVRRDTARAERALEELADLLRFSLDRVGDSLVDLAEELQFTRTYVELERLALGDRLEYREVVAEGAMDAEVPPFAVQALVENAVRHAVATRPEGGSISLTIAVEADALRIQVDDDGDGTSASGGGRGLRNLRDRLIALYGDGARLQAGPRPGRGFRARLTLPGP